MKSRSSLKSLPFYRHILSIVASFIIIFSIQAQNLVPNPSFETYTSCPTMVGPAGGWLMPCTPWDGGTTSSDYFNGCASFPVGVPLNFQGFQYAHTGFAYCGMYFKGTSTFLYREFIGAPLLQTLEAGKCYKIGFWLNLANTSCGINQVGARLTPSGPINNPIGANPQITGGGLFYSDTVQWAFVFDFYQAVGNEAYITIGNFHTDPETPFDPSCNNEPPFSYYYVDDVLVEEVPSIPFDVTLDGPLSACDSMMLEPMLNPPIVDAKYEWSNGSTEPQITVHFSGEYTVTVTYGCVEVEASVEVNLNNPSPVVLGPDIIVCEGETYSVSLDPDSGNYEWNDGSTDTDYTIDAPGIYQVTLDDGCDITSDEIVVDYLAPPSPFYLGNDTIVCEGEEIVFQFDPSLGDFLWQDNSDDAEYSVTTAGTYALTISNMCGEESDDIDIDELSPPSFYIGPDSVILCDADVINIDLDPDLGTFLWQDGSTFSSYTITGPGQYSVTVTNFCGVETGETFASQFIQPVADLGLPIQSCAGDTIVLNPGINTGMFLWQDSSSLSTYSVTTNGTYAVTISNVCGADADSVDVQFNPLVLPPDLGPDFSLCPGEQEVLYANASIGQFLWSDNSTADSLLITSAGIYFVNVYNSCNSFSDTVLVTMNSNPPSIVLPADFGLCQGQTTTLDAGITGVSYLWNDGSLLSQLAVSSPGLYSLTVTNACGTDIDSVMILDGGPGPIVSLGSDSDLCMGDTVILTPSFSNVDSWIWQDGSSTSSFLVTSPGLIYIDVANSCSTAHDTVMINALPSIPILSLGPDTAICPGESITLSIGYSNVDILWSDGSTNADFTVNDSSTIYSSISNSCGVSTDSITISFLPDIPSLNLGPDQNLCLGEVILLDPNIPDVTYLWQDGSTNPSYQIDHGGLFFLSIANACGETTDSIHITVSTDGPQLDLGPDLKACTGEMVTIPAGISGVNYLWQDGSVNNEFVTSVSGAFILSVSNLCGVDTDTIVVDISGLPPSTDIGPDTTLCEGNTLLLTANNVNLSSLIWQDGSSSPSYLVSSAGTYILTETNKCGAGKDSINIAFSDAPEAFDLGHDTIICPGESFLLFAPVTLDNILWQDGSNNQTLVADKANTYILQISNHCGIQSDSLNVGIDQQLPLLNLDTLLRWCAGDVFILNASQSIAASYLWNTGDITPTLSVSGPGLYSIDVTTHCASISDAVEIIPEIDCTKGDDIYVPNVFSPNGDGNNDLFSIFIGSDIDVLSIQGSVFDRWGNMVFNSTTYPFEWDGHFKQDRMMPGVYVYKLHLTYKLNGSTFVKDFSGDVTLIR